MSAINLRRRSGTEVSFVWSTHVKIRIKWRAMMSYWRYRKITGRSSPMERTEGNWLRSPNQTMLILSITTLSPLAQTIWASKMNKNQMWSSNNRLWFLNRHQIRLRITCLPGNENSKSLYSKNKLEWISCNNKVQPKIEHSQLVRYRISLRQEDRVIVSWWGNLILPKDQKTKE